MGLQSRRSLLSLLGIGLPFGLGALPGTSRGEGPGAPALRFRSFEEAVRAAFADSSASGSEASFCRRIEVGYSDLVRAGIQGSHNDRPFAGFPAGHLRIVRTGSEPGPEHRGVRLFVSTVDVALTGGLTPAGPSRPLDFQALPPAPSLA